MRFAARVLLAIVTLLTTTDTAGAMTDAPHPYLGAACCWLLFVAFLFLYYLVVTVIFRWRAWDTDHSREERP
jgi:hypothetical protein